MAFNDADDAKTKEYRSGSKVLDLLITGDRDKKVHSRRCKHRSKKWFSSWYCDMKPCRLSW